MRNKAIFMTSCAGIVFGVITVNASILSRNADSHFVRVLDLDEARHLLGGCDCEKAGNGCTEECSAYTHCNVSPYYIKSCYNGSICVAGGTKNCCQCPDGYCSVQVNYAGEGCTGESGVDNGDPTWRVTLLSCNAGGECPTC